MVAVGILGSFVRTTGDTMTGDLVLSGTGTDLTVGGAVNINYGGFSSVNAAELLATMTSSGVISGGEFTPNADPTKLDISAMIGYIVDYNSSAPITGTNPMFTRISLPAQVGLVLTGPPSQTTTWWLVNSAGTIIQQATNPTPAQRRTHIVLGATAQFGGVIFIDQTLPVIPSQLGNQLADLMDKLGPFTTSGNVISANGANLSINKTAGEMFARAFSQIPTYLDPHTAQLAAQTPVTARRATALAVLPTLETLIDVGNYDPNGLGVVSPVPGGANVATNFRVWGFASNGVTDQVAVQYGQSTHSTLSAAAAAVHAGTYIPNSLFIDGALLGWLSVIHTATDLSDTNQAIFTAAGPFDRP